jgi:hypothetical protein
MKAAILVAALALAASAAAAQTPQEQAACRADAQRHCAQHIGKQQEMRACLVANKEKLSQACRTVVENRGG